MEDHNVVVAATAFVLGLLLTDKLLRAPHRRAQQERYAWKSQQLAQRIHECDERLSWSATRIAKALREGEFTSVDITLAYIKHLEMVNLFSNSIVASRFDTALREAREADVRLERYRKHGGGGEVIPPFLGVPLMSKEVFELPGMPYSAGVWALRNRYGNDTSFALRKAQQEGGVIVLGVGNISEQCMWMESSNTVYGRTNNPYNAARTVGGSSGGTASSVSALGAAFAITSDVGGSTRIPSLFNGLFGIKPTGGSVSNDHTTPFTVGRLNWFCQLGPVSRHSEDLLPMLRILAGPGPRDARFGEFQTKVNAKQRWVSDEVPMNALKVLDCRRQPGSRGPLSVFESRREVSMIEAHDRVASYLKKQAVSFEQVDVPEFSEGFDIWGAMMGEAQGDRPFRQVLAEGKESAGSLFWALRETIWWLLTWGHLSDHTLPALALGSLEFFESLAYAKNANLVKKGEKLRAHIASLLGENGVMLLPSLPTSAPEHGLHFLLRASECAATGMINILEFPSCAIPLGLDKNGLPVGIQVIANLGNDHLCISVARALEKAGIAGWVPPPIPQ